MVWCGVVWWNVVLVCAVMCGVAILSGQICLSYVGFLDRERNQQACLGKPKLQTGKLFLVGSNRLIQVKI
jgi:hypothetical protein